MWKKMLLLALASVLPTSMLTEFAIGKDYPTNPIEIYCPYSPGGPADITSRVVANVATKFLGQPLVVVTKTGAGGSIAAAELISSKPDGYKLLMLTNHFFASTVKTQKIPFNPNHLVPIACFAQDILGMAVRGDSPWKTLGEFLDYGKKNPSKIRWGHTGRGNVNHVMTLAVFKKAGVETIDIPYKGFPEIVVALLGGHLEALGGPLPTLQDHVKDKKVRFLVLYTGKRSAALPEVPSADEVGFPEVAGCAPFWGLYAHKDTPQDVQKTLFEAFKKTYDDPEFKKGIENVGLELRFGGAEFLRESIKKAEEIAVPILKEVGLYIAPN